MPLCRLGVVRLADDVLLDLDELVDAQQPAHILARAARFAAETGRKTGVEDWQLVGLEDFTRMERGQHHLGSAGEPQIIVGQLVGFLLVPWELALVEERLLGCLGKLDPEKQRIVLLAYYSGWSRDQLSKKLDIPVNTIKTWLRRSLLEIRECLGQ